MTRTITLISNDFAELSNRHLEFAQTLQKIEANKTPADVKKFQSYACAKELEPKRFRAILRQLRDAKIVKLTRIKVAKVVAEKASN